MNRVENVLRLKELNALRRRKTDFSIAVLDSGAEPHPDISRQIIGFKDFVHHRETLYDDYGHGTHIIGMICGNGQMSQGKYTGVIPGAFVVSLKVLDQKGNGEISNMVDALQWILDYGETYRIRIVNISLSLEKKLDISKKQVLLDKIEKLLKKDYIITAAAGNNGPLPMSISEIGEGSGVIAVGCHDLDYKSITGKNCEEYSARGPSKFAIKKPDIVAPGTDIMSCNYNFGRGKNVFYTRKSGTSMSTAVVSGCIGILLNHKTDLTGQMVRQCMFRSAVDLKEPWNKQGWGMIYPSGMINSVLFG